MNKTLEVNHVRQELDMNLIIWKLFNSNKDHF